MIKIDYDNLYAEVEYKDADVIVIYWYCNIGYGHLYLDANTHKIIYDEKMGKEFCDKVIEKVKEQIK